MLCNILIESKGDFDPTFYFIVGNQITHTTEFFNIINNDDIKLAQSKSILEYFKNEKHIEVGWASHSYYYCTNFKDHTDEEMTIDEILSVIEYTFETYVKFVLNEHSLCFMDKEKRYKIFRDNSELEVNPDILKYIKENGALYG